MAVTMSFKPMTFTTLCQKIGLVTPNAEKLKAAGAVVSFDTENGLLFVVSETLGINIDLDCNTSLMQQLKLGKIAPTAATFLREELATAIDAAFGGAGGHKAPDVAFDLPENVVTAEVFDKAGLKEHTINTTSSSPSPKKTTPAPDLLSVPMPGGGSDEYDKIKQMLSQPSKQKTGETAALVWGFFPQAKMASASVVQLKDATQLYQPVHGTSADSRYFAVALSEQLKTAARYQGATLSVRFEGVRLSENEMQQRLKMAGLKVSALIGGGYYASIHVEVPDDIIASKALASIISSAGHAFSTPYPVVEVIKNV